MARYRKKPVEIDAWQFNGWDDSWPANVPDWITEVERVYSRSQPGDVRRELHPIDATPILVIVTLEGEMIASAGSWIIRGVTGELYPCRDDVFQKSYEAVE